MKNHPTIPSFLATMAMVLAAVLPGRSAVVFYTDNPTSNSTDWENTVTALPGGGVDELNFDGHVLGPLVPSTFAGMTVAGTGPYAAVIDSAGPAQPGSGADSSNGEGLHGVSHILLDDTISGTTPGSFTITFDTAVRAVGMMTVDLWNQSPTGNQVTLEFFDGVSGSGASLGSAVAVAKEFQQNYLYFMGGISDSSDIRSAVFSSFGTAGDLVAIDHVAVGTVPEPTTGLLLIFGFGLVALRRRLKGVGAAAALTALAIFQWPAALRADDFGSGGNAFSIDFVSIGNAGNANDAGAGGGSTFGDFGGVAYDYRMAKYEVSQNMIEKATALGMTNVTADAWTGDRPAATINWYEAAAFVNWLNTSTGHQAAYDLSWNGTNWTMSLWSSGDAWQAGGENIFRHKDAYYFLPSEDEWYKAAFHQNDGITANYYDYTTGSNTAPDGLSSESDPTYDAVFGSAVHPHDITDVGSAASAYGTYGQGGNVNEWMESATDGDNDTANEARPLRGGAWYSFDTELRSNSRYTASGVISSYTDSGLRVGSVPEPSSLLLLVVAGAAAILRRRQTRHP